MTANRANEGDLVRLIAILDQPGLSFGAGQAFDVVLRCGAERPLEFHARVPPTLTPLVELEWQEAA